jgi:uncharacterized protein YuzE
MKIDRLVVKSSGAPTLEVDHDAGAAYLRFRRGKVARTVPRSGSGAFVAIDLDRSGDVLGVEIIGADVIEIHRILKRAAVDAPDVDFSRLRYRSTTPVAA